MSRSCDRGGHDWEADDPDIAGDIPSDGDWRRLSIDLQSHDVPERRARLYRDPGLWRQPDLKQVGQKLHALIGDLDDAPLLADPALRQSDGAVLHGRVDGVAVGASSMCSPTVTRNGAIVPCRTDATRAARKTRSGSQLGPDWRNQQL